MKQSLRVLLALVLVLALSSSAWAFTDTAGLNSSQLAAVEHLSALGVINGYEDDTFRPHEPVTRAEFAKMICVYAGYSEQSGNSSFSDVPDNTWYAGWVNRAAGQSLVQGNTDGTYLPNSTISQQELATILLRLEGLDETDMAWPADYITAARERGLDNGFSFSGSTAASRVIAAQMIYNLVEVEEPEVPEPQTNTTSDADAVRGIVMKLDSGSITIQDIDGKNHQFTISGGRTPSGLIVGSYIDVEAKDGAVSEVKEHVNPRKSTAYWDISRDGKTAYIDGKRYNIDGADIFAVSYRLNTTYSADSFLSGGPANMGAFSLGGTMGAEMAVIVSGEDSSRVRVAYLVNASVSGGNQVGVVDSFYNEGGQTYLKLLGRSGGLPVSDSLSRRGLDEGVVISYTVKNGEIDATDVILDIDAGTVGRPTGGFSGDDDAIAGFVDGGGGVNRNPSIIGDVTSEVIAYDRGSYITLGSSESNSTRYSMASDCQVFEYNGSKVKTGSSRSISEGDEVIALVTNTSEVLLVFVYK